MKKNIATITLIALILIASAGYAKVETQEKRYFVTLANGTDASIIEKYGEIRYQYKTMPVVSAILTSKAAERLKQEPGIESIEEVPVHQATEEEQMQWQTQPKGTTLQTMTATATSDAIQALESITIPWNFTEQGANIQAAWQNFDVNGEGIKIALIDSGVNWGLPDLDDHNLGGYDFAYDDEEPDDYWGGGTHRASIILGEGQDKITGVAPKAQYHALKIYGDDGRVRDDDEAYAIEEAIDHNVDIIFSARRTGPCTQKVWEPIKAAFSADIVVVAGSAKFGEDHAYCPACYPQVISVGAHTQSQEILTNSNGGVDLIAPGENIPYLANSGNIKTASSTGVAAAHAAGALALMIQYAKQNGISYDNNFLRETLMHSAVDLGLDPLYQGTGKLDINAALTWMDNNWFLSYDVNYLNANAFDENNTPIYYPGQQMQYNISITNDSNRIINPKTITDLNVFSKQTINGTEHKFQTTIPELLPGQTTTIGPYTISIPTETTKGYYNTEIVVKKERKIWHGRGPTWSEWGLNQISVLENNDKAGTFRVLPAPLSLDYNITYLNPRRFEAGEPVYYPGNWMQYKITIRNSSNSKTPALIVWSKPMCSVEDGCWELPVMGTEIQALDANETATVGPHSFGIPVHAEPGPKYIHISFEVAEETVFEDNSNGWILGVPEPEGILHLADMPSYVKEKDYYSGATAAKMILDYIRQAAGHGQVDEDSLYEYGMAAEGQDLNAEAMDLVLGHFDPYDSIVSNRFDYYDSLPGGNPYQGYNYFVDAHDNVEDYMRDIAHWMAYTVTQEDWWRKDANLVAAPNTPAALPIYGDYNHWVVLNGYAVSKNPAPYPRTNPWYTPDLNIYGFWLTDPDTNGIGQHVYVTAADANAIYFKPMDTNDIYNGKYIQIAEPPMLPPEMDLETESNAKAEIVKPVSDKASLEFIGVESKAVTAQKGSGTATGFSLSRLETRMGEAQPEEEKENWKEIVDPYILYDQKAVTAFENAERGEPLKVQGPETGYYLVPFNKEELTTGVIMLDAKEGYFKQASWTTKPEKYPTVGEENAISTVKKQINPKPTESLKLEFNSFEEAETQLAWKPGKYSKSPFKPYWQIELEGGKWIITQKGEVHEIQASTSSKLATTIAEIGETPPESTGFAALGKYYEILNPELENGTFSVTLTFSYNDADSDGIVDGTSIGEEELKVYYFDEGNGWTEVAGPVINSEENTVSATVNHFSLFAVMSEQPGAEAEPEPQPENSGGSTGLGQRSSGGGGSSNKLEIKIKGSCVNEPIEVTILNTKGNPAPNATVTVVKDRKTVAEEKTDFTGKLSFTFSEEGEYTFGAKKTGYTFNSKKITLTKCRQEPEAEELGNKEMGTGRELEPAQTEGENSSLIASSEQSNESLGQGSIENYLVPAGFAAMGMNAVATLALAALAIAFVLWAVFWKTKQ